MKVTYYNEDIPEWLKPNMRIFCDCGAVMVDDGPIDYTGVMKLTQRMCGDPKCPYHMARRVVKLASYFQLEGIGPATAYDIIKSHNLQTHIESIPYLMIEPPRVHLYEIGELAYIYGVQSEWKDWLAGYTSFEDYYNTAQCIPKVALDNKDYLIDSQQYFNIKQDKIASSVLKIMISGSMKGYSSRREFLAVLNSICNPYFRIEDNKKTVRDTFCLVIEPTSIDYDKTQIAINNNIPIYDSETFTKIVGRLKGELENENEGVH